MAGVSDPRTKSESLSGGKREGVSGPGVGSVVNVVQEGGVGTIRLDTVGLVSEAGGVAHAESTTSNNAGLKINLLTSFCDMII